MALSDTIVACHKPPERHIEGNQPSETSAAFFLPRNAGYPFQQLLKTHVRRVLTTNVLKMRAKSNFFRTIVLSATTTQSYGNGSSLEVQATG